MALPTEITVKLKVECSEEPGKILLSHPSLQGVLQFSTINEEMALVQLQAIRLDRDTSPVDDFLKDAKALLSLSSQLKEAVKDLKSKT